MSDKFKWKCEECYAALDVKCECGSSVRVLTKPKCLWFREVDPKWQKVFESAEDVAP